MDPPAVLPPLRSVLDLSARSGFRGDSSFRILVGNERIVRPKVGQGRLRADQRDGNTWRLMRRFVGRASGRLDLAFGCGIGPGYSASRLRRSVVARVSIHGAGREKRGSFDRNHTAGGGS